MLAGAWGGGVGGGLVHFFFFFLLLHSMCDACMLAGLKEQDRPLSHMAGLREHVEPFSPSNV